MSEVTDLIEAMRRGEITLEELAQAFSERTWPRMFVKKSPEERMRDAHLGELPEIVPNSWAEVDLAVHGGRLTEDEYQFLSEARRSRRRSDA